MNTATLPAHIRDAYVIMVCQCCMLAHANGKCCAEQAQKHDDGTYCFEGAYNCGYFSHTYDPDAPLLHGGDGCEPLSLIEDTDGIALGMGWERHAEDCDTFRTQGNAPGGYECECERDTFSRSQCEGCGSHLHGERHAMTVFPGERVG